MSADVEARLLARSERDDETGCLRWTGSHTEKGYGQMSVGGRLQRVHRLAHEVWIGPIPDGLEVDHVAAQGCRHRDCIEPTHLEAVTHAENVVRVPPDRRPRAQVEECVNGHEFTPANTKWRQRDGYRERRCATCIRNRRRAYKQNRRAREAAPTPPSPPTATEASTSVEGDGEVSDG